mgnify:CR=1 FL=1
MKAALGATAVTALSREVLAHDSGGPEPDELVVGALIVWEPWWWSLRQSRPELADLRVLEAPAVSEPWVGVGGITLADRAFVRSSVDEAVAALSADGTIQAILDEFGFPGRAVP